jgi:hypothetical protein
VITPEEFTVPNYKLLWPRFEGPDPETRVRAATLLEVSEEPGHGPRLLEAATDPDPNVRSAAIWSLANIGDPRGGEVSPEAFGDDAWFVRPRQPAWPVSRRSRASTTRP